MILAEAIPAAVAIVGAAGIGFVLGQVSERRAWMLRDVAREEARMGRIDTEETTT